mgnify:CR=1 FL=1|jgi:hypothetical protein|nr:MAG TPA: hypothetical protein [Caudoviricetes sp.]
MGLKKYEIITVGSDKRVRALRSWQVGDRYVNIGDVGGIVYDEKTLSQDGACWLFRGNFGFPGARIGGDSIVDVGEAALSAAGAPNVDILGYSVVVGANLLFESEQTKADAVVLTADDFEQGGYASLTVGQKPGKDDGSVNFIRTKNPIFLGGKSTVIKAPVPGYIVTVLVTDADGYIIKPYKTVITNEYQAIPVEAGQYAYIQVTKNPASPTIPADAADAAITFTGTYETKLSVIDSRLEVNPANATGTTTIRPGGIHTIASGVKYPDSVIRNSKVVINGHATANRVVRLMSEFIGCNVAIDATQNNAQSVGIYSNVNNLTFTGAVSANSLNVNVPRGIQATDCDNFAVSPTVFPGLISARPVNMPFIFQGCNVPGGRFYHHAQIANTYKNIDFAKAQADLGKSIASDGILASSEVEGMYRIYFAVFGALVESYASVKSLNMADLAKSYGTTIYKDAYLNGLFDIAGTNVFGNKVRSHPLAQVLNVAPRAVQGKFNNTTVGGVISGIVAANNWVAIAAPFRLNSPDGIKITNSGAVLFDSIAYAVDANNKIVAVSTKIRGDRTFAAFATYAKVYIAMQKIDGTVITPADLAGVTVTVYNGCKIINTGETSVNMKGNIRVKDNATLVNASVTGSGYFGGNSVVHYNPTVGASLDFNGTVYMKDNTVFAPSALTGASALVRMEGNAKFTGSVDVASTNLSFIMRDNAVIEGKVNTRSGVVMSGNSKVTATGQIMAASRGVLVMEENASIEANTTVIGAIALSGNYKGNVVKTWTGKRTITDVNAPEYDNNVKTQYDF